MATARLEWDKIAEKLYETGVKEVVLYTYGSSGYDTGVPWNGITAVNEAPSGAEATPLYANDHKYIELRSAEEYGFTVEAYTYPDEFEACDGSANLGIKGVSVRQQTRKRFGLSYVTTVGNDTDGNDYGEKLHVIYGASASPSARDHATINDAPEAVTFSWECTTTPVTFTHDSKNYTTSVIEFDSADLTADSYKAIKDKLQGSSTAAATLPDPATLIALAVTKTA